MFMFSRYCFSFFFFPWFCLKGQTGVKRGTISCRNHSVPEWEHTFLPRWYYSIWDFWAIPRRRGHAGCYSLGSFAIAANPSIRFLYLCMGRIIVLTRPHTGPPRAHTVGSGSLGERKIYADTDTTQGLSVSGQRPGRWKWGVVGLWWDCGGGREGGTQFGTRRVNSRKNYYWITTKGILGHHIDAVGLCG